MCVFLALVICLPTEASEGCSEINGKNAQIKYEVYTESTLVECKEKCGERKLCLLWQVEDDKCTLSLVQVKRKKNNSFGVPNCEGDSGEAESCGENVNMAVSFEEKTVSGQEKTQCQEDCLNDKNCLLWLFTESKKTKQCVLTLYKEVPNTGSVFGVRYCATPDNILPDECRNYKELNEPSRSINYGDGTFASIKDHYHCDHNATWAKKFNKSPNWIGEGWYRMTGEAGTRLPEEAVDKFHCGTYASGWVKQHPTSTGSTEVVQICFKADCSWSNEGKITNCDEFFVYYLKDTPACRLRYCAKD